MAPQSVALRPPIKPAYGERGACCWRITETAGYLWRGELYLREQSYFHLGSPRKGKKATNHATSLCRQRGSATLVALPSRTRTVAIDPATGGSVAPLSLHHYPQVDGGKSNSSAFAGQD